MDFGGLEEISLPHEIPASRVIVMVLYLGKFDNGSFEGKLRSVEVRWGEILNQSLTMRFIGPRRQRPKIWHT